MIQRSTPSSGYDVIVIGGGPGGTAAAMFLQRAGHRCLVLEKARFPRYHIGESLIPHTYGTLDRLGLLPALKRSAYPAKYSVRFVSPDGRRADPFYFSEVLPEEKARTWQVDRASFDQLCLDYAREQGVEVRTDTRVRQVNFEGDRAVGVEAQNGTDRSYDISARVVIDASGRQAVIGEQLGLRRSVPGLRKASVWGYYRGAKRWPGIDAGETTIFLHPDGGWFWYTPLPDDLVSVGLVADTDRVFAETRDCPTIFEREIQRCPALMERLSEAERAGRVRGIPVLAYRNAQMEGEGWVMIGDAAAFLDPIYSSGLFLALGSAELAAGAVDEALRSDDVSAERLGSFRPTLLNGVEVIRRLIHAFYDPEFRFGRFARTYPQHRRELIDCLIGDVLEKDMEPFMQALAQMTPPPPPLDAPDPAETT